MPPLNEGTLLYMPTAIPECRSPRPPRSCKSRTAFCGRFPEVERVFGKAGQAETPTDPAPLSMFETVLQLKPPDQWRPGMTWEKLIAEMNDQQNAGNGSNLLDADSNPNRNVDHRISFGSGNQSLWSGS